MSYIIRKSRGAQVRANQVVVNRLPLADHPDVGQALHVNLVVRDEIIVLVDERFKVVEKGGDLLCVPGREVPGHAADAHVVESEACSAQLFQQVVDLLSLTERMEERGVGADVLDHRSN